MSFRLVVLVGLVAFVALAGAKLLPAEEAVKPAPGITALDWLAGSWQSADGTWEAVYTSAGGGEVLSATKQIKGGKVTLYDFERFREQDGKVLLTPFPHGKASVDFTLTGFDPAVKQAIFVNPEHDFPQRMRYERTADGHLKITLAGEQGGKHVGFSLDLVPKTK